MTKWVARTALTRWNLHRLSRSRTGIMPWARLPYLRNPHVSQPLQEAEQPKKPTDDPRVNDIGRAIEDDYATIREKYDTPQNPIILAHGLLGFDELHLFGPFLPSLQYWRGITHALTSNNIRVITTSVPASSRIEERALALSRDIASKAAGQSVNIIAHSMGGLDARYMISQLRPEGVKVLSLTTIATPHRGSAVADWVFESIGRENLSGIYRVVERVGMGTGAFAQLTRRYMEEFNPKTPDVEGVRYFSYGAMMVRPRLFSAFRQSHRIVEGVEGENDGLVSVNSSRWGTYKGTLVDVSHLDLINWSNRVRWAVGALWGDRKKFNAIAFYLDIADMLAKEGL